MHNTKRHARTTARTVAVLALAASAILAPHQAAAADGHSDRDLPAGIRVALQRDLGLTTREVPRYLDAERLAMRRQAEARRMLGASYAGSWLERDATGTFRFVVATTQKTQATKAQALGANTRVVQRSLAQLETVMARLNRGQAALGKRGARGVMDPAIHSWRIDLRSNTVVVTTDVGAQEKAVDFIAASGADVRAIRFETAKTRPQATYDIRGGDRYSPSGCSVGFSVRQGTSTGFATAGHCGGVNAPVSGQNGVAIGHVAGSQFPGADHAWVRNTNPGAWVIRPWVNTYNGGNLNVIGNQDVPIGGTVCRSGATTGWRCGVITARNVTVNYGNGPIYGLTQANACVGFGDSGGSFISANGEAQGVTSGGGGIDASGNNCAYGTSAATFYQPIQPLLNAYGLVLETVQTCGRMNPGRILPTGGAVTSCNGRYTFTIQTDGHLVLYRNGVGPIWANQVFGSGHTLEMQTDGNLVVYNSARQPRWSTHTWGRNGALLRVQDDGNVVIYSHQGQPLWHTNTSGR
jgi:hypothetical protein